VASFLLGLILNSRHLLCLVRSSTAGSWLVNPSTLSGPATSSILFSDFRVISGGVREATSAPRTGSKLGMRMGLHDSGTNREAIREACGGHFGACRPGHDCHYPRPTIRCGWSRFWSFTGRELRCMTLSLPPALTFMRLGCNGVSGSTTPLYFYWRLTERTSCAQCRDRVL
jgi:hypothetical protein